MTEHHAVSAVFVAAATLAVTAGPDGAGAVTATPEGMALPVGSIVCLSAEPADGFVFDRWIGDVADPFNADTAILLNANKAVSAQFISASTKADEAALLTIAGLGVALIGLAAGGEKDSGGGPCFIATAAYGTPRASELGTLRAFRDNYLLNTALGSAFVDAYYRVSPSIADEVAKSPLLAGLVRAVLTPVVMMAKGVMAAPWLMGVTLLGMVVVVFAHRRRRWE